MNINNLPWKQTADERFGSILQEINRLDSRNADFFASEFQEIRKTLLCALRFGSLEGEKRKKLIERLNSVLQTAQLGFQYKDQRAAWFALLLVREILGLIPESKVYRKPSMDFEHLSYLIDDLDRKDFCHACDEVDMLIYCANCIADFRARNRVLYVLVIHENLQLEKQKDLFSDETNNSREG